MYKIFTSYRPQNKDSKINLTALTKTLSFDEELYVPSHSYTAPEAVWEGAQERQPCRGHDSIPECPDFAEQNGRRPEHDSERSSLGYSELAKHPVTGKTELIIHVHIFN